MRYEISDIKPTKMMNMILAFFGLIGIGFSIYVFTHVAEISGVVTERQVILNKENLEAKVIFKVNGKEFIYRDSVSELVENESFTEYKLTAIDFNIGDTIKVNYKDAYADRKPTFHSENMQFKVLSAAKIPFDNVEEQAMDLVEQYNFITLNQDTSSLKNMIHPDSNREISFFEVSDYAEKNQTEVNIINPKFKLIEDMYELTVRENILLNSTQSTTPAIIQKNKSVYTFKFDGAQLKINSIETEVISKKK
jgi:hypothetical protein